MINDPMKGLNRFFKGLQGAALVVLLLLNCIGVVGAAPLPHAKVVINIPSRTLWLYDRDELVRYYPVGVGRVGFPTPLGQHRVIRKISHPGWENPYKPKGAVRIKAGKGNPLGTRWIGFKAYKGGEYGIHGTNQPNSVGKFSSHGCVRMKIPDAEALFDQVAMGTPVEIRYDPVLIRQKENQVILIVYPDTHRKGMPSAAEIQKRILTQYPQVRLDAGQVSRAIQQKQQKPVLVGEIPDESARESTAVAPY